MGCPGGVPFHRPLVSRPALAAGPGTFSGSVRTRLKAPSPKGRCPPGRLLKDAHGSRRRTCCKSAGFHPGANLEPLCRPLQTTIRFLQLPLPATPWPSLTLGLPLPGWVAAVRRVYLVSQGALSVGRPTDGVRDSLSAGCSSGNEPPSMIFGSRASCRFWPQLPLASEWRQALAVS